MIHPIHGMMINNDNAPARPIFVKIRHIGTMRIAIKMRTNKTPTRMMPAPRPLIMLVSCC